MTGPSHGVRVAMMGGLELSIERKIGGLGLLD
jgi:hypothetical protein